MLLDNEGDRPVSDRSARYALKLAVEEVQALGLPVAESIHLIAWGADLIIHTMRTGDLDVEGSTAWAEEAARRVKSE